MHRHTYVQNWLNSCLKNSGLNRIQTSDVWYLWSALPKKLSRQLEAGHVQGKQVKQMNMWSSQIVPNLISCENKSDKLSCKYENTGM